MKTGFLCTFGLILLVQAAAAEAPASPPAQSGVDQASYAALLGELKAGHTDVDYGRLRDLYARSDQYDPYGRPAAADAMVAAMKADDCAKVVSAANEVLDKDFTDIEAHILASNCAAQLHDTSSANFHRAVAMGLLRSIAKSGDGTTSQSPYVVIAVKEEYAFLYSQGYRVTTQALVKCATGECDAMDVVDGKGEKKTFFFDVSRPFAWMSAKFSESGKGH